MAKKKNLKSKQNKSKGKSKGKSPVSLWMASLKNWWASKAPVFKFSMSFFGMMTLFYVFWFTPFFKNFILAPWNQLNAWAAGMVLKLVGFDIGVSGQTLTGEGGGLSIQQGCDALEPTALFIIGVIAAPAPLKAKLSGILYGSLAILGINFFRVLTLFLTEKYWPAGFEFMHVEFWQVAFILLAICIWAYWLSRSVNSKNDETSSEASA
ncbi:MAG: archaeosortase/exosortase family protein [Bacteroidota bacterium]